MAFHAYCYYSVSQDSERMYTKIMDVLCGEYGKQFNWDVKVQLMGKKERESAQLCIGKPVI